jgi:hypothetical protein
MPAGDRIVVHGLVRMFSLKRASRVRDEAGMALSK